MVCSFVTAVLIFISANLFLISEYSGNQFTGTRADITQTMTHPINPMRASVREPSSSITNKGDPETYVDSLEELESTHESGIGSHLSNASLNKILSDASADISRIKELETGNKEDLWLLSDKVSRVL